MRASLFCLTTVGNRAEIEQGDAIDETHRAAFDECLRIVKRVWTEELFANRQDLRAHPVLPPTKRPARKTERVWYPRRDSNPQPSDSKSDALSVELQGQASAEF